MTMADKITQVEDMSRPFTVEITDDAMACADSWLSIPRGALLECDPSQEADHGDAVVARLPGSGGMVVRELATDGGAWRLLAPNPAYPPIALDGPSAVVARVMVVITRRSIK